MEQLLNLFAPAMIIVGALMTASNLGAKITGIGFVAFTLGSLAWLGIGMIAGPFSLVWQNVVLTALNGFGIWRWLGRQRQFEEGGEKAAERSRRITSESLFPASRLTSAEIQDRGSNKLGSLVDAMVGGSSGRVSYLVLAEGGLAGVGETLRRVPFERVRTDGETFVGDFDKDELDKFDRLERDRWPDR
jgi:hypothetical protein